VNRASLFKLITLARCKERECSRFHFTRRQRRRKVVNKATLVVALSEKILKYAINTQRRQCARRKFMLVRLLCALSLLPTHAEMRARGVIFAARACKFIRCAFEFIWPRLHNRVFQNPLFFHSANWIRSCRKTHFLTHLARISARGVRNDPLMDGHSLTSNVQ
jgi:hypothetical protein